jgi:hypothetical protein
LEVNIRRRYPAIKHIYIEASAITAHPAAG